MKRSSKFKKPNAPPKLILEEIIGLTTKNANGLASSISNSKCAYIAGCVVVLYDVDSCTQSHLVVPNRMPKPLSCVAVSRDGSFIAAGESGQQPAVLVWDAATMQFVCELKSHQFGVACIAFSPDGKHLASVGFPHDGYMCLWDWRSQILLTKTKACSSCSAVVSVSFTLDAKFIVTAGKKHLKFWKFANSTRSRASIRPISWLMQGKPITLPQYKGCSFITVSSPNWTESTPKDNIPDPPSAPTYALTDSGILCLLDSNMSITTSVELKVEQCFALSVSKKLVACACNNGVVKLFTVKSLKYSGSLYYCEGNKHRKRKAEDHHLNISQNEFQHFPILPDAVACQFSTLGKLVVIYNDHSIYIWDIQDVREATRCCVLVSHKACIWDIKNLLCENMHDPSISCVVKGCSGGVSFTTCSADGTIRLWDLVLQPVSSEDRWFLDSNNNSLITETCGRRSLVSAGIFERDSVASDVGSPGFRSMAVSSDGKYLAAGDCLGNLHIFNLNTSEHKCIQNAHDGEILSLSFSLASKKNFACDTISASNNFLASGGRDRMIHLYDVGRDFELIGQDDHSAAVTSIKLACNGNKLLSSSADRSLVFRDIAVTNPENKITCCHQIACHGSVYDMAVDTSSEIAVTVGQDKKINTFCTSSGKLIKSFKNDDLRDPIKVTIDPSCSYLVCAHSSRRICLYDYMTGEMVAQAAGHSNVITGVIFLPDCRHLVSVDGDGCIFVWKLPGHLSSRMLQRTLENSCPLSPESMQCPLIKSQIRLDPVDDHPGFSCKAVALKRNPNEVSQRLPSQNMSSHKPSEFKFSISRLPKWAQSKFDYSDFMPADNHYTSSKHSGIQNLSSSVDRVLDHSSCRESENPSNGGCKKSQGCMSRASSDTDSSQGSPMPEKNFSSALDNRWLTIHTVFFDHLSSPEVWQMNNLNLPVCSLKNLSEDQAMGRTSKSKRIKLSPLEHNFEPSRQAETQSNKLNNRDRLDALGTLCNNVKKLSVSNSSSYHDNITNVMSTTLLSDPNEYVVEETTNDDSREKFSPENEGMKIRSLSPNSKEERRKSSARESYSAQVVVRGNLLGGWKPFCGMPPKNFLGESLSRATKMIPHGLLEDGPSMESFKEVAKAGANSPSRNSPAANTDAAIFRGARKSVSMEVPKPGNQEVVLDRLSKKETAIACKEALSNLESVADSAFHLFSKFGNLDFGENLSACEAQFYTEAAGMIAQIQKKVNAVARLAQPANRGSCQKTGADNLTTIPLSVGTSVDDSSQNAGETLNKRSTSY